MSAPRTVAVLTTTRADAWPLGPVIAALDADPAIRLVLVATGTHVGGEGSSLADLSVGPDSVLETFDAGIDDDDPAVLTAATAAVATGMADVLARHGVEVLVLLGDRYELLGAAAAALLHQVAVAHLHGGEVTEGAIDERVRHALTKLADVHLAATGEAARRILQMGEEPWRVHVTGAPSLDRFEGVAPGDLGALSAELGVELARPFGIVTYHPPTVERGGVEERAAAVLEAGAAALASAVVTAPGADPGGGAVRRAIDAAVARHPHLHFVPNLGPRYAAAMATADVMLGNSSSGVIEAASFRLPVVDVGDRQQGRLRGANVVHCDEAPDDIAAALATALDPAFRKGLDALVNPYGDGRAAHRIAEILRTISLGDLRRKRFTDPPPPP